MADVDDYLQEGFDPRSVTMPRLRSILVTHSVDYPSTAKKAQLVQLVEEYVLPQAPKIRAQKARAKRSSMGIVNAGSAEDTGNWDDHDLAPPPSVKRSKSPRKSSTRVKTEDYDNIPPPPRSISKRTSRSASRALSHANETPEPEPPVSASSRRTSRRTITPQIKPEPEDEEIPAEGNKSAFTNDNPFQSGSSPPSTKTPRSRRQTGDVDTTRSVKSSRRRTENSVPKFREPQVAYDEMEPGEEFTPDEQIGLEEAEDKGEVRLPSRQSPHQSGRKTSFTTPLLVLIVTLLGVYGAWYRQEKIGVGYCGLGRQPQQIIPPNVPIPDFAIPFVEAQCEQCPAHAYCYENFEARCEPDFLLRSHPLSFGGLIPLPPTCEPDGEKARRVQAVADKAIEVLREKRAKYECRSLKDQDGGNTPSIDEQELKETVSRKRSKRLNSAEFEDLWVAAIGEVTSREEVEVEPATRFVARARYRRHVTTSAQVPALVDLVMTRLSNQKELGEEGIDDAWLFLPNLRDDVLRSVHSLSERESIWRKVKVVVEQNSNVRTGQREGRNGEVGRAWEWIGPIAGEGARRRRSGRVSLTTDIAKEESPAPEKPVQQVKKWDEPRPLY
ncbi:Man1-Src1p-C-terminal domain [Geosmithia morbida]|uniref:Man1-Src1p-C-terminal domain n=1 Tax=Geosmithia morbida TaxID=1094350 RepID=A0A9P5D1Q2_9HYPO|nr:Man1-Src1p-C-terminal domain [Geosmithia morbida]KAF4124173.1 Man1-Src1p-C-terminal domain [Geosmithia morbida]